MSELERPANSASKTDWVAYVQAREDIKDKSDAKRDDLIARADAADKALLDAQADPADPTPTDPPAGDPDERDPVNPVHTFKVVNSDQGEPMRAGGHVLAEGRGWVPEEHLPADTDESEQDAEENA